MERYADYTYYAETYGGSMPEVSFNRMSARMSLYIDKITFGRLKSLADTPEWLKFACCELCEMQFAYDSSKEEGKNVKAISNDGYTVTFSDDSTSDEGHATSLRDAASIYIPAEYLSFDTRGELTGG